MTARTRQTRKQELAIAALLTTGTIVEAAQVAGVGEKTLRRWLREDRDFQAAYQAARQEAVRTAVGRLQGLVAQAAETLSRSQFRSALRSFVSDLWELLGDRDRARAVTNDTVVQERREVWARLDQEVQDQIRQAARLLLEREEARQARGR